MDDLSDQRLHGYCLYCGQSATTREHVPARLLLDDPLPSNLHTVEACFSCNNSFSKDEEYLGCLLEVIVCGSTSEKHRMRPKVRQALDRQPKLAARIEHCREIVQGKSVWRPELVRISNVIRKLAQGHAAYDLVETALFSPYVQEPRVAVAPLQNLSSTALKVFEEAMVDELWPEVGSRAMQRLALMSLQPEPWVAVQAGRYRYMTSCEGPTVRLVLSEYLAAEVMWG